jgi:flagellar motor protein MotB
MTEDTDLREAMRTVRGTWRIWILLALTIVIGGLGAAQLYTQRDAALRDLAAADARATQKQAELVLAEQSRTTLDQRVKRLEEENRAFEAYRAEREAAAKGGEALQMIQGSMRAAIEEKNRAELAQGAIKIEAHSSTLAISIAEKLLFDAADATLSKNGSDLLTRIAGLLTGAGNRSVRVEESFDPSDKGRPMVGGTWELSAARAAATARFLREKTPLKESVAAISAEPSAVRAHRVFIVVSSSAGDSLRNPR